MPCNLALAVLSMLTLLSGLPMFTVLFYAPLLFQGKFGMSPQEASLVITPLAVCITLDSTINGHIVTRIPRSNVVLYADSVLLTVAVEDMPMSSWGISYVVLTPLMLLARLGLGFVLPNLTVFVQ